MNKKRFNEPLKGILVWATVPGKITQQEGRDCPVIIRFSGDHTTFTTLAP